MAGRLGAIQGHPIHPSGLPTPRRGDRLAEANVSDEVFEREERRAMTNHQDSAAGECRGGLSEPCRNTTHDLLIALTAWERNRDMVYTPLFDF